MATVCGYCLWLLFVATVCGYCLWLLLVATVCGYCLWLLFVATVCGYCLWLLFVATVCGYCLWLLFVATLCGYCLWLLFVATVCRAAQRSPPLIPGILTPLSPPLSPGILTGSPPYPHPRAPHITSAGRRALVVNPSPPLPPGILTPLSPPLSPGILTGSPPILTPGPLTSPAPVVVRSSSTFPRLYPQVSSPLFPHLYPQASSPRDPHTTSAGRRALVVIPPPRLYPHRILTGILTARLTPPAPVDASSSAGRRRAPASILTGSPPILTPGPSHHQRWSSWARRHPSPVSPAILTGILAKSGAWGLGLGAWVWAGGLERGL